MIWSLAIATYNRPAALRSCLEFATAQSRPPNEVVIVDSSDNWEVHKRMVLEEIAPRSAPTIDWRYERARERGVTRQRNQAITTASGDVLFVLDDDSFMYHDCAEEVMRIYEADVRGCVAGVAPIQVSQPPDSLAPSPGAAVSTMTGTSPVGVMPTFMQHIRWMAERQINVEHLLLPYDRSYPDHPIPSELVGAAVGQARYFSGFRMTFRAAIVRRVGFDETLRRYSAVEDLDTSYRASRYGVLLNAFKARIFHAEDRSARLSRHTRTLLGLLNLAYLYRRNGYDSARILSAYRWRVLHRLFVDIVRDAVRGRVTLPCARADLKGLIGIGEIARAPIDGIAEWYAKFQEQIAERNAD
jgi:GT2 family glycosyltransferase